MSTIAEDSAFIEMMAAAFERCGISVSILVPDYYRLRAIAGTNPSLLPDRRAGYFEMSLTTARALVNTAREVLVQRVTRKLEA